jgi:hypothetical protein
MTPFPTPPMPRSFMKPFLNVFDVILRELQATERIQT